MENKTLKVELEERRKKFQYLETIVNDVDKLCATIYEDQIKSLKGQFEVKNFEAALRIQIEFYQPTSSNREDEQVVREGATPPILKVLTRESVEEWKIKLGKV